jgi:hypothetical protein
VPVGNLLHGRQTAEYSSDGFEAGMSSTGLVELTIDGNKVSVAAGTTVFDAARVNGIAIPTLCGFSPRLAFAPSKRAWW